VAEGSIQAYLHQCRAAKGIIGFTPEELATETKTDALLKRIVKHLDAVVEMGINCADSDTVLTNHAEFCELASLIHDVPTIEFIEAVVKNDYRCSIEHHFGLLSMMVMLTTFRNKGQISILEWMQSILLWGCLADHSRQPIKDNIVKHDWGRAAAFYTKLLAKEIAMAPIVHFTAPKMVDVYDEVVNGLTDMVGQHFVDAGIAKRINTKVVVIGSVGHPTITTACRVPGKLLEPSFSAKPFWVQRQEKQSRRQHRR
jgi:hypothetical protein